MIHYWGAQAIVERAGYKTSGNLPSLILRYHIPAYKRRNPKMPCNLIFYSNEAMMARWDLDRAKRFYDQVQGEADSKQLVKEERGKYGLRGSLKRSAPAK